MTSKTIIDQMRESLVPGGKLPLVRLHISNGSMYLNQDFVTSCINELEYMQTRITLVRRFAKRLTNFHTRFVSTRYTYLARNVDPQGSKCLWSVSASRSFDDFNLSTDWRNGLLGESPSNLEKLAYMLLCDSAHINAKDQKPAGENYDT